MNDHFKAGARNDLREAAEYCNLRRAGLGFEFAVEVGMGISQVLQAPRRRPEIAAGVHKYRPDRFPCAILYRVPGANRVEFVAVFDQRRQPDSWERRPN